jgi:hypothetical protein
MGNLALQPVGAWSLLPGPVSLDQIRYREMVCLSNSRLALTCYNVVGRHSSNSQNIQFGAVQSHA